MIEVTRIPLVGCGWRGQALLLGLMFGGVNVRAGMTVYSLTDVARLRLEDISFFLFLLVLCTCGVRLLWNLFAKDFPRLPKLGFMQALGLTSLISLAMLLVLVMISGAREVLTPEAWRRQGSHYRPNDIGNLEERQQSMQSLRSGLMHYATTHAGQFPSHDYVPEIPAKLWEAPDSTGTRYLYFAGLTSGASNAVVACEPQHFGEERLVLFGDGTIKTLKARDLPAALGTDGAR